MCTLREEKNQTWKPFFPYLEASGKKGSQKGSLHGQEPKKVLYTGWPPKKTPANVDQI